jgi:leader peptidase (prepilin peptidase)/N-methyltransferase
VTAVAAVAAALVGAAAGVLVDRRAAVLLAGTPAPAVPSAAPPRRPALLALVTGLLFALLVLTRGLTWDLPAFLQLAAAGVLLAVVDLRHRLLPDRVVVPSLGAGALLLAVAAAAGDAWPQLPRAALAALVLFAAYLALALVSPGGMGMGDVKLAALLGLHLGWLGWGAVVLGAAAGFAVQSVVALGLLATRRVGLRSELPFGPAMLLGALLALIAIT